MKKLIFLNKLIIIKINKKKNHLIKDVKLVLLKINKVYFIILFIYSFKWNVTF